MSAVVIYANRTPTECDYPNGKPNVCLFARHALCQQTHPSPALQPVYRLINDHSASVRASSKEGDGLDVSPARPTAPHLVINL